MKNYFNLSNIQQKLNANYQFDLRAFALFRIVLGFVMLLDICIRLSDFTVFYTQNGVLPFQYFSQYFDKYYFLPIYQLNDAPWFVGICFAVHLMAIFCFAIGYRTKLFQVITLLFYISLHMRNPYVLQGGDDLIRCMLLFSLFMPLNAIWAVQTKKVTHNYTFYALVFMFQVLMVYWVSACMKNSAEWHNDATALYYAFNLDIIQWPLAQYLLQFPTLLKVLTHVVFYFEILIPILFFIPFKNQKMRAIGIVCIVLFQIGIASTLYVGLFYLINLCALIPLLPTQFFSYFKIEQQNDNLQYADNKILTSTSVLIISYVIVWNTSNMPQFKYGLAQKFKSFGFTIGVNQNWGMFAPAVFKDDGWLIFETILVNGDTIDLNRNNQKINYQKPDHVIDLIKNDRWRKYNEHIVSAGNMWLRQPLKKYYINRYESNILDKNMKVKKFYMLYRKEFTVPPNNPFSLRTEYLLY